MRQLRDATIEELLGEVFSMRSALRCYKQDKSRVSVALRESSASKNLKTEAQEATALESTEKIIDCVN
jgi:hypothetical protein